ncbi:MAG: TolC family protein [Gemmatimonadetes bacterium]|nr:TolC family protein [Gemmatimonadota bacterium]
MKTRVLSLLGLLAVGTVGATAQGRLPSIPQTLSLQDALELSEIYSPIYAQTLNDRGPAAWGVRNAYGSFLPTLNVSSNATYSGAGTQRFLTTNFVQPSATIGSSYSLTLNWTLNGNTLLQPGVQKAALSATDASIDAARMTLRSAVVQQYVAVLEAEAQVALQERQVARNIENLRLAQARHDVGQTTMIDVRQAEVTKGQSDVALLVAEHLVLVNKLTLFQSMGIPAPADPMVVTLSDSFPIIEPHWSLDELLADAEAYNPDMNNLRAQQTSAEWNERSVKSQWLPSLNFIANWSGFTQQFTNGEFLVTSARSQSVANIGGCQESNVINQDLNSRLGLDRPIVGDCNAQFGITPADENAIRASNSVFPFNFFNQPFFLRATVSLPIFDQFNRNLQVSRASAQAEDMKELSRARELQVRTDVSQTFYGLLAAHRAIEIQENNRVAARESTRLARERYRVGAGTFFELLDAQLANEQAEADYITAVFAYHRALVGLEAAVGRPLR